MCGIVSVCHGREVPGLGHEAGELLKRLEYRGYDSTGAAFVRGDRSVKLLKKVGAPSRVVPEMGIDREAAAVRRPVRWATYGAVTDANAQPHHVRCRVELVGAHNGNISSTDTLRPRLSAGGHDVVSDNDGEALTHLAEDASPTASPTRRSSSPRAGGARGGPRRRRPRPGAPPDRGRAPRRRGGRGLVRRRLRRPGLGRIVAVKSGSSLYAGIGSDETGELVLVSSDLVGPLADPDARPARRGGGDLVHPEGVRRLPRSRARSRSPRRGPAARS